jgi:5-methylcytosine-specific restriction endonuclease McrBC regulatory subunit McrC
MRAFTVVESHSTQLSITDQQADALQELGRRLASRAGWWGQSTDNAGEEPEPKSVIRCQRTGSRWTVRVTDAIGLVGVEGVQLVVQPKIPLSHLIYLLEQSGHVPRLQPEAGLLEAGPSFWELVARWYVAAAQAVLRRDMARDYEARHEVLAVVRGTVDPLRTTRDLLRGRVAVHCTFDDYTQNNPLNRLLREAARLVAASSVLPWELRSAALAIALRLDEVDDLREGDLLATTDRRTHYYADAVALSKQIIRGVDRNLGSGEYRSRTFLFRTPEAVEAGVRQVLQRELPGRVVKSGLMLPPSRMTLNPDLVFDDGRAVGDVKYKLQQPDWRRGDLYQAVTFATGYGSHKAVIIGFEPSESASRPPSLTIGSVRLTSLSWRADVHVPPTTAGVELAGEVAEWLAS